MYDPREDDSYSEYSPMVEKEGLSEHEFRYLITHRVADFAKWWTKQGRNMIRPINLN